MAVLLLEILKEETKNHWIVPLTLKIKYAHMYTNLLLKEKEISNLI